MNIPTDLSMRQVEYLKALWDDAILVTSPDFEYPCYFGYPDIEEAEEKELEVKGLIGWHDGWNITYKGIEAYHANKQCLPYYSQRKAK